MNVASMSNFPLLDIVKLRLRHSGTQALRHSGTQALRLSGSLRLSDSGSVTQAH